MDVFVVIAEVPAKSVDRLAGLNFDLVQRAAVAARGLMKICEADIDETVADSGNRQHRPTELKREESCKTARSDVRGAQAAV